MAKKKDKEEKNDGKSEAVNVAIEQIEKQFGKGSIMRLGADNPREHIEAIPTG